MGGEAVGPEGSGRPAPHFTGGDMTLPANLLQQLLEAAAVVVGGLLVHAIKTPKAHERAAVLSAIANEAAAWIVAHYPDKPWAELLEAVVQRIATAAGLSTRNATAIENAAAAALTRLGKAPANGRR